MQNQKFIFSFNNLNYNVSIIKSNGNELHAEIDGVFQKYHIVEIDNLIYIHSMDFGNIL